MTDEEIAVNWIRSQGWSEETLPSDEFGQMFQAFLAGIKAGRPQWHDLRKNPEDLPKKEGDYYWCLYDKETKSVFYETLGLANRYADREDWYIESMLWTIEDVIAWCEIPEYTEKE